MKRSTEVATSLASVSLHREGSLMVRVDPTASHCGHKSVLDADNRLQVHYEVDLRCFPTLDERGFLADQEELHQTLLRTVRDATIRSSCELLAITWGGLLLDTIVRENPHIEVQELTLKVSPFPHKGWLSATFEHRATAVAGVLRDA